MMPPIYPLEAAAARVQGTVILDVQVDERGVPEHIEVLKSVPILDAAAIEAVRQWRWTPFVFQGNPTPFVVTLDVVFRLQ